MKLKKVICAVAAFTMLSINYLPSVSFAKEQNYVCPMINAGHAAVQAAQVFSSALLALPKVHATVPPLFQG